MAAAENFNFTRDLSSVPISGGEIAQAIKYYPIVFPMDGVLPQALLTLQQGKNAYVDDSGRWLAPYVPAHIRRYPFILGKGKDSDKLMVCVDRDAPQFQKDGGSSLFKKTGEPTEVLSKAIEFLKRFHADLAVTENLLKPLVENDLLVSRQINLEIGGKKSVIRGFRVVDTKRLNALDDALLGKWVKSGIMSIVFAHILSLGNIRQMPVKPVS
jgi:hypothetical protein